MKCLLIFTVLFLSSLASAECSFPAADKAGEILEPLEKNYGKIESISAKFTQNSFFGLMRNSTKQSRGEVYFRKPGKMRWNYQEPETQVYVSDGASLWHHQPELEQVSVSSLSKAFSSDAPVAFLLGVGEVSESFNLASFCKDSNRLTYELKPKEESSDLSLFSLTVDSTTFAPLSASTESLSGNNTEINFEDVRLNKKLESSKFAFTVPDGIDLRDFRE